MKIKFYISLFIVFLLAFSLPSCTGTPYPNKGEDINNSVNNAPNSDYDEVDLEGIEKDQTWYVALRKDGEIVGYEIVGTFLKEGVEEYTLPTTFNDLPIIALGGFGVSWNYELKKLVIPEGYKYIAAEFYEVDSLEEIVLPESLVSLEENAFSGMPSLKKINIPGSIKIIPKNAFYQCTNLNNVVVSEGITEIGFGAFEECYSLDNITLPEGITKIGDCAFEGCPFKNLDFLPDSVEEIGTSCFTGDYLSPCVLEYIKFPKNLKQVKDYSFSYIDTLKSIEIPSALSSIGGFCFMGSTNPLRQSQLSHVAIYLDENNELTLTSLTTLHFKIFH